VPLAPTGRVIYYFLLYTVHYYRPILGYQPCITQLLVLRAVFLQADLEQDPTLNKILRNLTAFNSIMSTAKNLMKDQTAAAAVSAPIRPGSSVEFLPGEANGGPEEYGHTGVARGTAVAAPVALATAVAPDTSVDAASCAADGRIMNDAAKPRKIKIKAPRPGRPQGGGAGASDDGLPPFEPGPLRHRPAEQPASPLDAVKGPRARATVVARAQHSGWKVNEAGGAAPRARIDPVGLVCLARLQEQMRGSASRLQRLRAMPRQSRVRSESVGETGGKCDSNKGSQALLQGWTGPAVQSPQRCCLQEGPGRPKLWASEAVPAGEGTSGTSADVSTADCGTAALSFPCFRSVSQHGPALECVDAQGQRELGAASHSIKFQAQSGSEQCTASFVASSMRAAHDAEIMHGSKKGVEPSTAAVADSELHVAKGLPHALSAVEAPAGSIGASELYAEDGHVDRQHNVAVLAPKTVAIGALGAVAASGQGWAEACARPSQGVTASTAWVGRPADVQIDGNEGKGGERSDEGTMTHVADVAPEACVGRAVSPAASAACSDYKVVPLVPAEASSVHNAMPSAPAETPGVCSDRVLAHLPGGFVMPAHGEGSGREEVCTKEANACRHAEESACVRGDGQRVDSEDEDDMKAAAPLLVKQTKEDVRSLCSCASDGKLLNL
jgi:hypothetical protein